MVKTKRSRGSSGSNAELRKDSKQQKVEGPHRGWGKSCSQSSTESESRVASELSDVLRETNEILYESPVRDAVFVEENSENLKKNDSVSVTMATNKEPTNADIVAFLARLDLKITSMIRRLESLYKLEKEVDKFEGELNKLWVSVNNQAKSAQERLTRVKEKVDCVDFTSSATNSRLQASDYFLMLLVIAPLTFI